MRAYRPLKHIGPFVLFVGAWIIAATPLAVGNDGIVRFDSLDLLLRDGHLARTKYSMYGPVAAAPLWYLGRAIGYPEDTVWVFNRIAFLGMTGALWLVLTPVVPRDERVRLVALLFFGSTFPWHVMGFFAEVFHVACVGTGLALLAVRRGAWAGLGAVLCVWGTANVPATAVGLALAAGVLCWQRHRLRYLALPVAAGALVLAENYLRRGDPFVGGYENEAGTPTVLPYSGRPGFSYPLFFGLLSVLFSFGKGLVFFTPGLFTRYPAAPGRAAGVGPDADAAARLVYRVWLAVVIGLVLVYARWWAWYGGAVWGPRFFLFAALPAALVLARWTAYPAAHSTRANVFVLGAVALSCWVGANGVIYQGAGSERFWANDFELEYLSWYVPEFSCLWMPFVVPKSLTWADYARAASFALGFAYLAAPVVRVLAVRGWGAGAAAWRAARTGPRWRF